MQAHAFETSLARQARLQEQGSESVRDGKEEVKLRGSEESATAPPKKYNEPGLNRIGGYQPLSPPSEIGTQIVLESIQEPTPEDWVETDIYVRDAQRMCMMCRQAHSWAVVTLGHIGWICVECCRLLAECGEIELGDQESQARNTTELTEGPDANCL